MHVSGKTLGRDANFLIENSPCKMLLFNGLPIEITADFH
jgi:hypothetical protein